MSKGFRIARQWLAGPVVLALAACSGSWFKIGDADEGPTSPASYVGAFAASNGSATESGVFRASSASPASGTIEFTSGGIVILNGDFTHPQLTLLGGSYSFSGTVSNRQLTGTYTGPSGGGGFVAFSDAGLTITVFCGSYSGTSSGEWNVVRSSLDLLGIAADVDGTKLELSGSMTPDGSVTIAFPGGSASGSLTSSADIGGSWRMPATGTIQESGSWSGSTTRC